MNRRALMTGNESIARGLIENGCSMALSYPGTPASEILSAVAKFSSQSSSPTHVRWAVNEKIAFETAYAGSIVGLRTAVSMKQVGLNVASDPLMSAAYMGVKGGFIVISADDPGPHSSQTEQDSRLMAMLAKVPVLDPCCPEHARDLVSVAFELSETFEIPVMLRPTTRVCHGGQDIELVEIKSVKSSPVFIRDPARWAATPKFRLDLHKNLNKKISIIAGYEPTKPKQLHPSSLKASKAVVSSGVVCAHVQEVAADIGLVGKIAIWGVDQPYPLHSDFIEFLLDSYDEILVIEESAPVIETQIADRRKVKGRLNGYVPLAGELSPESIEDLLRLFCGMPANLYAETTAGSGRKPSLCAGCPHRASFFAIKKAFPDAIYPSDIGCYTLGVNIEAVDTVLCMGASIGQASGFYHAFKLAGVHKEIVATIGDSTFFHSGVPPLIDAITQDSRFVLVILDNSTTAMTGNQPTPACGVDASGLKTPKIDLEDIVKGCGVGFCRVANPYYLPEFIRTLKDAGDYVREKALAVVIARYPCLVDKRNKGDLKERVNVCVADECVGCGYCLKQFGCPAIEFDEQNRRALINVKACSGCGVCIDVCPVGAIKEVVCDK